jgi:hypothetical protein
LHWRERNYIATCMATPPQWDLERKVAFARTNVAQLWQDATIVMAQSALTSGDHVSSTAVTQLPIRAAVKAKFLAKLQ